MAMYAPRAAESSARRAVLPRTTHYVKTVWHRKLLQAGRSGDSAEVLNVIEKYQNDFDVFDANVALQAIALTKESARGASARGEGAVGKGATRTVPRAPAPPPPVVSGAAEQARFKPPPPPAFGAGAGAINQLEKTQQVSPSDVVVSGGPQLNHVLMRPKLVDGLIERVVTSEDFLNPVDCGRMFSNCVMYMAKLGIKDLPRLRRIAEKRGSLIRFRCGGTGTCRVEGRGRRPEWRWDWERRWWGNCSWRERKMISVPHFWMAAAILVVGDQGCC